MIGLRIYLITSSLLLSMVGCSSDATQLSVVLDLPPPSSPSYPFGPDGVDTLRVAVAHSGDETDLLSTKAPTDTVLTLNGVGFARDLVLHLYGERNGVEFAYGRSCVFEFDQEASRPEAVHIYFTRVVRWGTGPQPLVANRVGGHTFVRSGGSVVIAGGDTDAQLELFSPITGEISLIAKAPTTIGRTGSALATVANEQAVIVGGVDPTGMPIDVLESLPNLRDSLTTGIGLRDHAVVGLVSGRALIAGGALWNGSTFEVSAAAWEVGTGDGGSITMPVPVGPLGSSRAQHTLTRLSDEVGAAVLVAGGVDNSGMPVSSVEVYRPLAKVFEPVVGTLTRWKHQAVRLPGGSVLIIGGFQPPTLPPGPAEPARELVLFDPIGGTFRLAGMLPAGASVTDFQLTTLPDGRVLMTGGRDTSGALNASTFIVRFDVINGLVDVVATDSLEIARAEHTTTSLCDGTILVSGGQTAVAGAPTERYNPTAASRR